MRQLFLVEDRYAAENIAGLPLHAGDDDRLILVGMRFRGIAGRRLVVVIAAACLGTGKGSRRRGVRYGLRGSARKRDQHHRNGGEKYHTIHRNPGFYSERAAPKARDT